MNKDHLMLAEAYERVIEEAKKKVNPWAIEKSMEKKKGEKFSPEKKEDIIKGIKKTAKKTGKNVTSEPVKKSKKK
jgi:hypothetical protein